MTPSSNYDSTVNSFYLAYYGRPADPAGLSYWSAQLESAGGNIGAIKEAFATSAETTARFGSEDLGARITAIYQQLFDREPEAAGLKFWTDAIGSGKMSLADAAIGIMHGAQSSDSALSDLRLQAAEKFTAEVASSGLDYHGDAAIAAARVLVEAVKLTSSADNITAMAKAAANLAHIATSNPAVIDAIGVGVHLSDLFDTARGTAEPVQLMQALADTAKAAAGDPVTLESLLRGGGMAKVLQVMPHDATLHDVVDALKAGGLPAAVEVVYPTAPIDTPVETPVVIPVEPASPLSLVFNHVTQGEGDTHLTDNVTNVRNADVSFSISRPLESGQHFEASLDGKNWSTEGVEMASAGGIVTVKGIDLGLGMQVGGPVLQGIFSLNVVNHNDLQTTTFLRAVDAGGTVGASASQAIVYDSYAAAPTVSIGGHAVESANAVGGGYVTNDKAFSIGNVEPGAKIQYMSDVVQTMLPVLGIQGFTISSSTSQLPSSMIIGSTGIWTDAAPTLGEGLNGFSVRQIDTAGNVSSATHAVITLDTQKPSAPTISLQQDTGIDANDGITSHGTVGIGGLSTEAGSGWDYSTNGGESWTPGNVNNGTGNGVFELSTLDTASGSLLVRQHDAAGNASDASGALSFTLDTAAPTAELGFIGIDGGKLGTATTDQSSVDVKFSVTGSDGIVQWQLGGGDPGKWATLDNSDGSVMVTKVDLSQADQTINLRVIDAAGNEGATFSKLIDSSVNDVAAATFSATPTETGLKVSSSVAGQVFMAVTDNVGESSNIPLGTDSATGGAVVGDTTITEQSVGLTGKLWLLPDSGGQVTDSSGLVYGLGSYTADTLTGSYVWGFGGADTINGTEARDFLFGGAGDDDIHSNGGADGIVGGTGADNIWLANDGFAKTVVVHAGDTATGVVVNGSSTVAFDHIFSAEKGDMIQLDAVFSAAPGSVQTSFLTSTAANQVAIIAGSDANNVFSTASQDGTYMVQWSDGAAVNSILLKGYFDIGTPGTPTLEVDYAAGTLTLATMVMLIGVADGGIPGGI